MNREPDEKPVEIKDPPADPQSKPIKGQTPQPPMPEPDGDSPGRVPVQPPEEPPDPNPVHVPHGRPIPGDLPFSNPDVIS